MFLFEKNRFIVKIVAYCHILYQYFCDFQTMHLGG